MTSRFATQFFDPEARIPKKANREEIEREQVERILRALSVVLVAGSIPRRLGSDATDEDLAEDRRRSRRAAHALSQSLKGWTRQKETPPIDDKIRQEGAQLDWQKFCEAHLTKLKHEATLAVTWALRNGEESWAKKATVRFNNEVNWFTYALR